MEETDAKELSVQVEDHEAIVVKADEVDDAGADISTISPTDDANFGALIEARRAQDARHGSPKALANDVPGVYKPPPRPILKREGSTPLPPQQPPPSAPPQNDGDLGAATDSLSLLQLRNLVRDLPKLEPTAYTYEHNDTRSLPEELQEWFQYTAEEKESLLGAKRAFEGKWRQAMKSGIDSQPLNWTEAQPHDREDYVNMLVHDVTSYDKHSRERSLQCLTYISLGVWGETAGLQTHEDDLNDAKEDIDVDDQASNKLSVKFSSQLQSILQAAEMFCKLGVPQVLIRLLKGTLQFEQEGSRHDDYPRENGTVSNDTTLSKAETNNALSILYVIVEVGRWQVSDSKVPAIRETIADLEPDVLLFLTEVVSKLRWDDSADLPISRILLLYWKCLLLLFGGTKELIESKKVLRQDADPSEVEHNEGLITASPLDYHMFRQEITSKYPAYIPPEPLIPLELENNSILPPLPSHPSRRPSQNVPPLGFTSNANGIGGSIFNQPVHIATPAPSPPPSPAGPGGKGGKKQNYQTNQNFPFLYPPLDDTSNILGGKGDAVVQDKLVSKKWEGSDIPTSIVEAGQLFASRMRMSRSIRQLWDVRENYIRCERGWDESNQRSLISEDDLHQDQEDEREPTDVTEDWEKEPASKRCQEQEAIEETENEEVQRRLDTVEQYYRNALPHLQSFAIVLWKTMFANVSVLVTQPHGQPVTNAVPFGEDGIDGGPGRRRANTNPSALTNGAMIDQNSDTIPSTDNAITELNAVRTREITTKAIGGTLLMLAKWFKLSHILKYEYLLQLLLDANYLPLILKLFAHQDMEKAAEAQNDRPELNFFSFCLLHSNHPPPPPPPPPKPRSQSPPSSADEALPPPILKHRRSPSSHSPPPSPSAIPAPPSPHYAHPYSSRFFYTTLTLLSLLHHITRHKAHRALLLVQYKSSTILRRLLSIPHPLLRLYTLKLFKSQVPYCGRKWRQSNMRVITMCYLYCKPELRDEWLCGGDVDGVVEEAVPVEWAGRSLVHWWHLRYYRGCMEGVKVDHEEEGDFFRRELEKMGWGGGEGEEGEEAAAAGGVGGEWEGGPLAMEGWT